MARPIEATPTLEGVDAENFYQELERPRSIAEIEGRRKMFVQADMIFKRYGKKFVQKMME